MKVTRKLIKMNANGTSRGVTIPAMWIQHLEKVHNQKLDYVELEIDGHITIQPIIKGVNNNDRAK